MKNITAHFLKTSLLGVLLLSAGLASAQPTGGEPPRLPPPEALAACNSLKAGQDCNFTVPHGTVSGTCWAPEGKPLACKPKEGPRGGAGPQK